MRVSSDTLLSFILTQGVNGTVPDGLGNGVFTGKGTPKSGIPSASHPIFCNRGLRLSDSPVLPLGTLLA